jgi:hypothetical protein
MKKLLYLSLLVLSTQALAQIRPATHIKEGVYYLRFDKAEAVILVHPDLSFDRDQRFAESILFSQQAMRAFKRPLVMSRQDEDTVQMLGSDNVRLTFYRKKNYWVLDAPPESVDVPLMLLSESHIGWRDKFKRIRKFRNIPTRARLGF